MIVNLDFDMKKIVMSEIVVRTWQLECKNLVCIPNKCEGSKR